MMPVPLSRKQRKLSRRRVSLMMPLEGTPSKSEFIFSWVSTATHSFVLVTPNCLCRKIHRNPRHSYRRIIHCSYGPGEYYHVLYPLPCSFLQETQLLFRAFLMKFILCCACGMAFKFITLDNNHSTFGMSRMMTPRTSFSPMMSQSQKTHQRRRVGSKDDDWFSGSRDSGRIEYAILRRNKERLRH